MTNRSVQSRKKKIIISIIVVIIVVAIIVGVSIRHYSRENENNLKPPNPNTQLPPSASKLRIFKKAAVCADHPRCAEIGTSILLKNGSAVDAVLAALFCNGVVTMQSMGIGGGFLMIIYDRNNEKVTTLDAREVAPLKSSPDFYKDDPNKTQQGILAVGVPGELKGYWAAHQRFGKLDWKDIVEPAIQLCEEGFKISNHQYDSLFRRTFIKNDPILKEWFIDENGYFKRPGSRIKPYQLCKTLRRISEKGAEDFYTGEIAKLLLEDIKQLGGIINSTDLENYQVNWNEPILSHLKSGDRIYTMPPPSSGLLINFILGILDGYSFNSNSINGVNNTVLTYHRMLESFKYAFAKRAELGDISFLNITSLISNLTSLKYLEEVRAKINDSQTYMNPEHYGGKFSQKEDFGTAHISVLAENGDAVSVTSSINIYFGSGTSKSTGIILNSVMDDFSFPDFNNYFLLPFSPHNSLKPKKRPLSSMSPTIVINKDGDVRMVVGASGGTKIITGVAQVIMRSLWLGQNVKEAVDAPRIHHQLIPNRVDYEYGNLEAIVKGLQEKGHAMERYTDGGSVVCALIKNGSSIFSNSDYRKEGDVFGIN